MFLDLKCRVIVHVSLSDNVIHLSSASSRQFWDIDLLNVRMWKRCAGFVATVIDYCTSVLMTWLIRFLQHFQMIQRMALRVLTCAVLSQRIISILQLLYWLPVKQNIDNKNAIFVLRSMLWLCPFLVNGCACS